MLKMVKNGEKQSRKVKNCQHESKSVNKVKNKNKKNGQKQLKQFFKNAQKRSKIIENVQ